MKKMLIMLTVLVAISICPLAVYADDFHDQAWRDHHQQIWRDHEMDWRMHDREWLAHRGDWHWREEHIRMWHDWYMWHRDHESFLNIHVSDDANGGPRLDIDISN
jgi:hypothetical protein